MAAIALSRYMAASILTPFTRLTVVTILCSIKMSQLMSDELVGMLLGRSVGYES